MHLALRGRKIAVPPHIRFLLTERNLTGHYHALRQITVTTVAAYRRFPLWVRYSRNVFGIVLRLPRTTWQFSVRSDKTY